MKVTETRRLDGYNIRKACIENEWYTKGTNEEYSALMDSVLGVPDITTERLLKIAMDILEHSEMNRDYTDEHEFVCDIMFKLAQECVSVFEVTEE